MSECTDSLSSGEDFHTEASKMCDIYRESSLTISAACSSSDLSGFLRQTPCPLPINYKCNIDHKLQLDLDPIHTRAWTFQESILPRRLLSFGSQEMYYECEVDQTCECHSITQNPTDGVGRIAYRKATSTIIQSYQAVTILEGIGMT